MTIGALLMALASPAARGDGFDSFLDGDAGVPSESSVLAPAEAPGTLAFGDDPVVADGGTGDSSAFVGGAADGRVVYPGSEPGFIPYGGGADGGFGAWYGPVESVGRGLFLPVSPRWIVQTDALFLWQGNIGSRPLYLNGDVTTTVPNPTPPPDGTPTTALDINQTNNAAAVGPRVGVILNLDNVYSVEGNYFNVRPFNGEHSTPPSTGENGYSLNNIAGTFNYTNLDWAQVTTNAALQSAELNWRRRTYGPVTWLAGFRWVEWNQNLQLLDHYTTTAPSGDPVMNAERFNVGTVNDLYGGQGGADVMLWNNGGPIRFNAVGKAGVFYNTAAQHFSGFSSTTVPSLSAAADQTAFFGELGVFGTWQITDWLAWRTGYNFFWLSGVAVPVDQLATNNAAKETATINTNGSVYLNGVQFGLESRW